MCMPVISMDRFQSLKIVSPFVYIIDICKKKFLLISPFMDRYWITLQKIASVYHPRCHISIFSEVEKDIRGWVVRNLYMYLEMFIDIFIKLTVIRNECEDTGVLAIKDPDSIQSRTITDSLLLCFSAYTWPDILQRPDTVNLMIESETWRQISLKYPESFISPTGYDKRSDTRPG